MIGRKAPLGFFRRSGIPIRGEKTATWWITLIAFFLLCFWVYNWKSQYLWPGNAINVPFPRWLDPNPAGIAELAKDPSTLLGTLAISASSRSFLLHAGVHDADHRVRHSAHSATQNPVRDVADA